MKSFRNLLLLGASALLLCGLIACTPAETGETETESVTETELVTEADTVVEKESETLADTVVTEADTEADTEAESLDYSLYSKTSNYMFLFNEAATDSTATAVTATESYGSSITIAENCYLTTFSAFTYSWNDNVGEMTLCFWRWDKDYATTTAADPVFTYTVTDSPDNSWVNVTLPKNTIGEGEWLYEFRNGSENMIGISMETGMVRANDGDDIVMGRSFKSGKPARNVFLKAYVTYDKYDTTELAPAPEADGYTKLADGKAHVIILAGDANATGLALGSGLESTVSAEQMARYREGYANVLIDYTADSNTSAGFVPVKLGQGQDVNKYGPELGLADYLSRNFPDETFYIVKSTATGSSLDKSWSDDGGSYYFFGVHVRLALDRLEAQGFEPEIFAFCWMQGDVDSKDQNSSIFYADREADLINRVNEDFEDYMAEGGMAVLDAAIYESPENTWSPLLNFYKRDFASRSQNYYYLDTNANGLNSDNVIEIGEMFGKAIADVLANAN